MDRPVVASYCTTFLKPEMLHIYRQITGLQRVRTFVVCKERRSAGRYPLDDVDVLPPRRSNFLRRFWLKYVLGEPPIVYRGEYRALAGVLQHRQADLMHVYFGHTGVHLLPFLERWEKPSVVSFHGMDIQPREDQPGYVERLAELLQVATLVLARSRSLADRLEALGCPPGKIRLNRTGIPMDRFPKGSRRAPDDGAWHLVQACRLIEKKGLPVTMRAFRTFANAHPKARLTIAGDGPMRGELEALSRDLGVADRVRFAGFLDEEALCALYQDAHFFLHPSQMTADQNQEGVPNSLLEAMATGLPVLATRHGGIPEAVEEGVTGILVDEGDDEALGRALLELVRDSGRAAVLGNAAAASVRREFESTAAIRRLEDAYFEAMGGEGAP